MSEANEQLNPLAVEGGLVAPSDAERNDVPTEGPTEDGAAAAELLQQDLDNAVESETEGGLQMNETESTLQEATPDVENGATDDIVPVNYDDPKIWTGIGGADAETEQAEQESGSLDGVKNEYDFDHVQHFAAPESNGTVANAAVTQEELDARFDADIDVNAAYAHALKQNMTVPPEFNPNLKPGEVTVDANGLQWVCLGKVQPETPPAPATPAPVDSDNNVVWVNPGQFSAPVYALPPKPVVPAVATKFKAVNGGAVVRAQKIKTFSTNTQTGEAFVVLSDGSTHPRPLTHGYVPHTGDYYVQMVPTTNLPDGSPYFEAPESAIIGGRLFEQLYVPAE